MSETKEFEFNSESVDLMCPRCYSDMGAEMNKSQEE
jgi:hypothetical protein